MGSCFYRIDPQTLDEQRFVVGGKGKIIEQISQQHQDIGIFVKGCIDDKEGGDLPFKQNSYDQNKYMTIRKEVIYHLHKIRMIKTL